MTPTTLPPHWQIKKLGEVFKIERGGSPRPIDDFITKDNNGINWIKIGDTKNSIKYITETKEKIKPEGAKRSRFVDVGDFLLSNSMSFGKPFIMKTNGCIHDGWLVIRKNENIDSDYLYHILNSNNLYTQFSNLAKGSTVKNLNIEAVKEAVITFPPLPEQEAIVAKIESLFAELEAGKSALLAAKEQIKLYRQSLLKAAFEGKLTENTAKSLVNNQLPNDWKWVKLGEVCDQILAGGDVPKNNFSPTKNANYTIPIFANGEKNDGLYGFTDISKVQKNAVSVSARGTIGFSRIRIAPFFPIVRLIVLIPNIELNLSFLNYFFEKLNVKHTGSSIPQLTVPTIKEFKLPLPPLPIQEKIVAILEEKLGECDALDATIEKSLTDAELLRQSILKEAFEGRLVKKINKK